MATIKIPGFKQFTTNPNTRAVDELDVTDALNVYWSGNTLEVRDGSSLWKNNNQSNWGRIKRAITYKRRDDNFFYVVVVTIDGRVFTIPSDDPDFGTPNAVWIELESELGTFPALTPDGDKYSLFVFNSMLYLADSTNAYYSWNGTDPGLTLEINPTDLGAANIVDFDVKSNRLVALDDAGRTHLSFVNNGTDFTSAGTGSLNYGRAEGLVATNVLSFNDDLIITTEDPLSVKYQAYRLFGIKFYDPNEVGSDTSQFEIRKVNSAASIIGESGQEIVGDTIGLSRQGFVSLLSIINKETVSERDYISFPIKELVRKINFQASNAISSVTDIDGKYYCAAPLGAGATEANVIFCYDYRRSSASEGINRWSLLSFDSFGDIGGLFTIQGQAYATDLEGNIYKLNDEEALYSDEDANGDKVAINVMIKTAAIGGQDTGTEKEFRELTFLITKIYQDFDLNIDLIVNGRFISNDIDGSIYRPVHIELSNQALLYDTPALLYDDFNLYDSNGYNQRLVTLVNRGGRANSIQWRFSTKTPGISWGLGSISIEADAIELANEAGKNNSGII